MIMSSVKYTDMLHVGIACLVIPHHHFISFTYHGESYVMNHIDPH